MKNNWSGDQYAQAVGWYFGMQDQLTAQQRQADSDYMLQSQIELTREWGTKFKENRRRS